MQKYIVFLLLLIPSAVQAVTITASRTAGIAPLSVHFYDSDVPESDGSGIEPFHDYHFAWHFDDPTSGTWGNSGASKNSETGPITGHVFESAGTYTVTLTVTSGSGVVGTDTETITVTGTDAHYTTTATTCFDNTGNSDWSGCPSGAGRVNTDDLSLLADYADANNRILLKRGASWTVSGDIDWPDNAGPVHIGAFGNCSNPDELGICDNAPTISMTGGDNFIDLSDKQNWRVSDISLSAPAIDNGIVAIFGVIGMKHHLIHRIKTTGFFCPLLWTHYRHNDTDYFDANAVISSQFTDMHQWALYGGSERLLVMGNVLKNSTVSHVLRAWQVYRGVISHNIISGSGDHNGSGNGALKLHGPAHPDDPNANCLMGTYDETGATGLRNYTKQVVVSHNVFGSSGPWPVGIGPQDSFKDERISDVIVEKNRMLAGYGRQNVQPVQRGLNLWGRYISARNNILDGTGGYLGYRGITVERRGVEWTPVGNRILNNTIYSDDNHTNGAMGIVIAADATDAIVRNNLISFPNTTGTLTMLDDSGSNTTASHNMMTASPLLADPDNASLLDRDYRLTDSSTTLIDQGYDVRSVGLFIDHEGHLRSIPFDIGADEYGSDPGANTPVAPQNLKILSQ